MENPNVLCEFCKKSFTKTTILKHIASNHLCKEHYGPRFLEMKKSRANEKKQNWRKLNKEKELEKQRILYAKNFEKKEKKRKYYEKKQSALAKKEGWRYVPNHEHKKQMAEKSDETMKGIQ